MSKANEMKTSLSNYFKEYIMTMTEKELFEFIVSCSDNIGKDLNNSCKPFQLPDNIFTCQDCEAKYGSCVEENVQREKNNNPPACYDRFIKHCHEG